jgi:hypothetical protein
MSVLCAGLGRISSWVWVTSQALLPTAISSLFVPPLPSCPLTSNSWQVHWKQMSENCLPFHLLAAGDDGDLVETHQLDCQPLPSLPPHKELWNVTFCQLDYCHLLPSLPPPGS